MVSHRHDELIFKLDTLKRLTQYNEIVVIFRDNRTSLAMKGYCQDLGIDYSSNVRDKGFSENNNLNFLRARELGMSNEDKFILLNPDILMLHSDIKKLLSTLKNKSLRLAAPNLYLNHKKTLFDDNLRTYPTLCNFVRNYLFGNRKTVVDKAHPHQITQEFWVSGAFLIVDPELYQQLNGFDQGYFLYCEDLDFCYRARELGEKVTFLPKIVAIHYRRCESRRFLSKPFFLHVASVFRYVLTTHGIKKPKSCIK